MPPKGGNLAAWGKCTHYTPRLVFDKPVTVYAGAGFEHGPVPTGATVLDLAGHLTPPVLAWGITVPGMATRYIRIQWPDHGQPRLSADDWRNIARAVRSARAPVMVGCAAGHGRTGTALAILGHFLKAFPSATTDPIAYVRKVYCGEAVETSGQVAYIEKITGRKTACAGSIKVTGPGAVTYGSGALCPEKVEGRFCNRDFGHAGNHDLRARHEILADLRYKATEGSQAAAVIPLSPTAAPTKFCHLTTKCVARAGHPGPCINVVGMPIRECQSSATTADDFNVEGE